MRHQRAFRRPGGAGSVDQAGGIVGGGCHHLEAIAAALQQRPEFVGGFTAIAADHPLQTGQVGLQPANVVIATGMHDGNARTAVAQAIFERLGAKQDGERQRHRAKFVDGEVRDDGFDGLRQHDGDAIAGFDTTGTQGIGQAIGKLLQLDEAITGPLAARIFVVDGDLVGALLMAFADLVSDIQTLGNRPAKLAANPLEIGRRVVNQSHHCLEKQELNTTPGNPESGPGC